MLNAILNNPYRTLGVYANSPKKEQIANKGKMQAFLRVGRTMDFPLDLKGILPEVARTQEAVDLADSELALPADQVKHAQFWFVNVTPIDGIAFNHLLQGDLEAAICLWQKQTNASSLQNLFVAYLIKEDYIDAINLCATPLYNDYAADFVKTIDENAAVNPTQLMEAVADTLTAEKVNTAFTFYKIEDEAWKNLFVAKEIEPIIRKLEECLAEAKSKNGEWSAGRLAAGQTLMEQTKPLFNALHHVIPIDDNRFKLISSKISSEAMSCARYYFKNSVDEDAASKVLPLCEFAKILASKETTKKEYEEFYNKIKESLPPAEVVEEVQIIRNIITEYRKKTKICENAIKMLTEASIPLVAIKEKLGNSHKAYLALSAKLANYAIDIVIDSVNSIGEEEEEIYWIKEHKIKDNLSNAWTVFLYIDMLDIEDQDIKDRYKQNRETLKSIIEKNFPLFFLYVNNKEQIDNIFITDDESYASCKNKSDYEKYLKKYPTGKHRLQARLKVEQLIYEACKSRKDFENYLTMYPRGNYVRQAKKKSEQFMYEACRQLSDFEQYLKIYPNGNYVKQAKLKVEKILFESCMNKKDYEVYLRKYPTGIYAAEARKKIKEEEQFFNACYSIQEFSNYLRTYPKGFYVAQAQIKINELKELERVRVKRERIIQAISLITLLLISSIIGFFAYVMSYPIYDQETGEELPLLEQIKWTFGFF